MLFQAQKEPITLTPSNEHSPTVEPPSEPEALDPRQQTLLKFFQPTPGHSCQQVDARYNNNRETSLLSAQLVQSDLTEIEPDRRASSISGSSTPSSTGVMDVDMNMDTDTNENFTPDRQWTSDISWVGFCQ